MPSFVDHYETLDIPPSASPNDIVIAFNDIVDSYRNGYHSYETAITARASYDVLICYEKRAAYDLEHKEWQQKKAERKLRKENERLASQNEAMRREKEESQKREEKYRRKSQQHESQARFLDSELRRQEDVNEKLLKSLEKLHVSSPKPSYPSNSLCTCRFCGKETSRPQSLRQHLAGMSTNSLCVERKILYLLQASDDLSDSDFDLLDSICTKLARASPEKLDEWEEKIPNLVAFQMKFAEEISISD